MKHDEIFGLPPEQRAAIYARWGGETIERPRAIDVPLMNIHLQVRLNENAAWLATWREAGTYSYDMFSRAAVVSVPNKDAATGALLVDNNAVRFGAEGEAANSEAARIAAVVHARKNWGALRIGGETSTQFARAIKEVAGAYNVAVLPPRFPVRPISFFGWRGRNNTNG